MKITVTGKEELTWGDSKVWRLDTEEQGTVFAFADKFPSPGTGELDGVAISEKNGKKYLQKERSGRSGGGGGRSGWRPLTHEEQLAIETAKYPSFAVSYWKDELVALINAGTTPNEAVKLTKGHPEAFLKKMQDFSKK